MYIFCCFQDMTNIGECVYGGLVECDAEEEETFLCMLTHVATHETNTNS